MCSYNLAVRHYRPSAPDGVNEQASNLLKSWASPIADEFGIDIENDMLTSSTDSGSDIKRAIEVVLKVHSERCISHVCHLALVDSFGTTLDPSKSKNPDARQVTNSRRKIIETLN